jgi:hypothetical protein
MNDDSFQELCRARPFRPFDVELSGGRTISVSHPELIYATDRDGDVGIALPDGTVEIVRLSIIKRLTPRPRTGNRHGGRGQSGK